MPVEIDSFPIRLFEKSQQRMWTPADFDYSREAADWQALTDPERELLVRLVAGFLVGERGVTHDLAPLQQALRRERGHIEEEMYLAAQLFEEAKHVEFFQRWIDATLPGVFGRDVPYPKLEGDLFSERLPAVMATLQDDPSPRAQVRAIVTYHIYIEGISAESFYPIYFDILEPRGIFPALLEGVRLVRRDEARHIAFGVYLLQRLLDEDPELEEIFEVELESHRPYIEAATDQTFAGFGSDVPFGLDPSKYRRLLLENLALQRRSVLERARVLA